MALAPLRDRINQKILGLEFHLSYVENKQREFLDVQKTLQGEPEKLVVNDRVKLFVGDGWFIEQSVEESLGFVKRRLDKLDEEVAQVNSNLDSARKAVADLEKLEFDEDVQKEAKKDDLDEYTTPEGLPMMDIREELDEDGNVVSSSVEPQKKDHDLKDFAEKHLTRVIQQREEDVKNERNDNSNIKEDEEYDSEGYKVIDGKRVYGPPRPPPKEESREKAQSQPKSILKKPNNVESSSKPMDKPPESMKRFMGQRDGKIPQESGRISEVTEDHDGSRKQQQPEGTPEKIEKSPTDESKHEQNEVFHKDSARESEPVERPALKHHHHSIDTEDLLQLELIANDLTENEEDMHFDGVDWEFEEDYEEEDDEEEDEYGRSSIGYERLTPEEIEKRTKAAEAAALDAKSNPQPSPDSEGKKQVRFASEVEINRFDKTKIAQSDSHTESGVLAPGNESEPQPEPEKKKRVSRFKAERVENKNTRAPFGGPQKFAPDVREQGPVGDIMERDGSDHQSNSMGKGIVKDTKESAPPLNSTVIERSPVNDVKEYQGPVGDIKEKGNEEPLKANMAGPVSDIKESDPTKQTSTKNSTGPLNEITERNGPVNNIVERAPPVNEAKSVSKEDRTSSPSEPQANEPSRRNIFKTSPNVPTSSRNQKIPPTLLRQPEKLKQVRAQPPTQIPGMEGEQPEIVPIEVSEEQQINDTVENVASTIKPQDVFSKEVYDLAKEHFKNAVVTEEQFIQAHDRESDDDDDEDEEPQQEEEKLDSRPILSTNIQENPTSTPPIPPSFLDTMDDSDSDEDFSVNMAQVSAEYHRIRNKLIQKTGGFKASNTEKQFESLDENGNPIKVSRFKAAKLSNRSI